MDEPRRDPLKSYDTIQEQQIEQAEEELSRPAIGLLLSGFAAGIEIGLGPFLMALVLTLAHAEYSAATVEILLASAYAVGFVVVILGRSELFTEHTALAHLQHSIAGTVEVLAGVFADSAVTWREFGRFLLWATLGNALGGVVFVALLKYGHSSQGTNRGYGFR